MCRRARERKRPLPATIMVIVVDVRSLVQLSAHSETFTKLTSSWRPILDVPGAVHYRVILAIPARWTQRVSLLHTMQTMSRCHVARRLQVADLHATDETPSRTHAQSHRRCN